MGLLPRYRHERGVPCIDVRVRTMRQLFDLHDPAPFRERDLDDDVADYLLGGLEDLPRARRVKIAVFIAEREPGDLTPEEIATAFRDHVRRAQFALVMGLAVLAAFLSLAELSALLGPGRGREIVREGLVIIAWVALWRPLEALLYDWWPHVQKRRLRDRMIAAPIEVFYGRSGP